MQRAEELHSLLEANEALRKQLADVCLVNDELRAQLQRSQQFVPEPQHGRIALTKSFDSNNYNEIESKDSVEQSNNSHREDVIESTVSMERTPDKSYFYGPIDEEDLNSLRRALRIDHQIRVAAARADIANGDEHDILHKLFGIAKITVKAKNGIESLRQWNESGVMTIGVGKGQKIVPFSTLPKLIRDSNGSSLLHLSAQRGDDSRYEIVGVMVDELKIPVDIVDLLGRTPLHYAAFEGKPNIVRELLRRGADSQAIDVCGFTPRGLCHRRATGSRDNVTKSAAYIEVLMHLNEAMANANGSDVVEGTLSSPTEGASSIGTPEDSSNVLSYGNARHQMDQFVPIGSPLAKLLWRNQPLTDSNLCEFSPSTKTHLFELSERRRKWMQNEGSMNTQVVTPYLYAEDDEDDYSSTISSHSATPNAPCIVRRPYTESHDDVACSLSPLFSDESNEREISSSSRSSVASYDSSISTSLRVASSFERANSTIRGLHIFVVLLVDRRSLVLKAPHERLPYLVRTRYVPLPELSTFKSTHIRDHATSLFEATNLPETMSGMNVESSTASYSVGACIGPFSSTSLARKFATAWRRSILLSEQSGICLADCDESQEDVEINLTQAITVSSKLNMVREGLLQSECPQRTGRGYCEYSAAQAGFALLTDESKWDEIQQVPDRRARYGKLHQENSTNSMFALSQKEKKELKFIGKVAFIHLDWLDFKSKKDKKRPMTVRTHADELRKYYDAKKDAYLDATNGMMDEKDALQNGHGVALTGLAHDGSGLAQGGSAQTRLTQTGLVKEELTQTELTHDGSGSAQSGLTQTGLVKEELTQEFKEHAVVDLMQNEAIRLDTTQEFTNQSSPLEFTSQSLPLETTTNQPNVISSNTADIQSSHGTAQAQVSIGSTDHDHCPVDTDNTYQQVHTTQDTTSTNYASDMPSHTNIDALNDQFTSTLQIDNETSLNNSVADTDMPAASAFFASPPRTSPSTISEPYTVAASMSNVELSTELTHHQCSDEFAHQCASVATSNVFVSNQQEETTSSVINPNAMIHSDQVTTKNDVISSDQVTTKNAMIPSNQVTTKNDETVHVATPAPNGPLHHNTSGMTDISNDEQNEWLGQDTSHNGEVSKSLSTLFDASVSVKDDDEEEDRAGDRPDDNDAAAAVDRADGNTNEYDSSQTMHTWWPNDSEWDEFDMSHEESTNVNSETYNNGRNSIKSATFSSSASTSSSASSATASSSSSTSSISHDTNHVPRSLHVIQVNGSNKHTMNEKTEMNSNKHRPITTTTRQNDTFIENQKFPIQQTDTNVEANEDGMNIDTFDSNNEMTRNDMKLEENQTESMDNDNTYNTMAATQFFSSPIANVQNTDAKDLFALKADRSQQNKNQINFMETTDEFHETSIHDWGWSYDDDFNKDD